MKKHILIFCVLLGCLAFFNVKAQINYQWVKAIHSTAPNPDLGKSVVADNDGNIYVTGRYGFSSGPGANFNPFGTNDVHLINDNGSNYDNFFAKYGADGNCIWAKSLDLGILPLIGILDIAVDANQNVYITGMFQGTAVDLDPDPNVFNNFSSSSGGKDCFFAKYNSNGDYIWAKRFSSTGDDAGTGIALIPSDTVIYITGFFGGLSPEFVDSFNTTEGTLSNTAGDKDIFIAKYLTDGTFKWAKAIGGSGEDIATAIDASDEYAVITGSFQNASVDFGGGFLLDAATGSKSAFVAKFHEDDGACGLANSLGGATSSDKAGGTGIAIYGTGIYVTGGFKGIIDFPNSGTTVSFTSTGGQDAFFAKYQTNNNLDFARPIGGNSSADSAFAYNIVVDISNNVYLTGAIAGQVNFSTSTGSVTDTLISTGGADIFFTKYDANGDESWARRMGSIKADKGYGIAVDNAENVYLTGSFGDTVDFDPNDGIANRICTDPNNIIDGADLFIAKYHQAGTSTISGTVTRSNGDSIDTGPNNFVSLYTQITNDGNAALHLVETTQINQQGYYSFSGLNTDTYWVLAIASIDDYQYAVPTYFGDTTHWDGAEPINTSPNTNSPADIVIQECNPGFFTGDATLSGTVLEGDGYNRAVGDPIPGVPIGLEGDPGSIIKANTTSNINGEYTFINVPVGNYKLYVNIPGLPMDSSYHVHVTLTSDSIKDLDFVADSSSIDTVPTIPNTVLETASYNTKMQIYPNPYKGLTTVEFTLVEANTVQIEVYNLLGERVSEVINEKRQAGIVRCRFNAANAGLKSGIYLLKLKVGDETISKKITQIE